MAARPLGMSPNFKPAEGDRKPVSFPEDIRVNVAHGSYHGDAAMFPLRLETAGEIPVVSHNREASRITETNSA